MAIGEADTAAQTRALLTAQAVVGALAGLGFGVFQSWHDGQSAGYGALIALAMTGLRAQSVRRATQIAAQHPSRAMVVLYIGAAARFLGVLGLFGAGMGVLKFAPVPVIVGFVAAQFAYLVAWRRRAA